MTSVRLDLILPKSPIANPAKVVREAEARLKTWAGNVTRRMQDYPTQQPTTYRRTGDLGKGWQMPAIRHVSGSLTAEVENDVSYTGYVQGPADGSPRQTRVMAAKGWPRLDTVAKDEFEKTIKGVNWSGK